MNDEDLTRLRERFGNHLQENVLMKNYTTIQSGGPAQALLIAQDKNELEDLVRSIWELDLPLLVIGSGSNVLVSDRGIREVVIINHAHNISIHTEGRDYWVTAESGALMATVARQAVNRHLSGLEWAATLPGTVGGAIYGNAGCFGRETADSFIQAEILHPKKGKVIYRKEDMSFTYRSSILKREKDHCVILDGCFSLQPGDGEQMIEKIEANKIQRQTAQPAGASMGSVFRNPPHEKAGKLIEGAGLKGKKIGGAEVSNQHANFILNTSKGSSQDIWDLINLIENTVFNKYGFYLQPEIEIVGEWDAEIYNAFKKFQGSKEIA